MKKIIATAVLGASLLAASPAFAHEVQKGDTMSSIAQANGLTLQELTMANPQVQDVNLIYVGQTIKTSTVNSPKVSSSATDTSKESQSVKASAKTLTVTATAYTANCAGCSGTTATGIDLRSNPNQKVIAVDPNVIPLGSKVYVEGYGEAIAGDTGGAITGNKIDVFIPNHTDAVQFGVRTVNVKVY
ncbi:3D domain-containing protein [Bacillus atrophaeus]|nr:3D domain-containing protein [Bacillus atrophaeus]